MVTSTPHVRSGDTIESIMRDVLLALSPAAIMAVYFFGIRALCIIILSVGACIGFEYLFELLTHRPITITDCSAAVTGALLAFNLPASSPFWIPVVGAFFAVVITKQLFGGLGQNFMNPALAARAFLMAAYTPLMAGSWTRPVRNLLSADLISSATPLGLLKEGPSFIIQGSDLLNAFLGNVAGCIGETSVLALLLGAAYLFHKKIITWHIPAAYIFTVFVLGTLLGRRGLFTGQGYYEILTGGLMLGALFMATDYSTSPVNDTGKIIMGIGCGILTVVIRNFGGYPEGVSYSILIMNLFVPLLDKYCIPRVFGVVKKKKRETA
ncbi:MAG: RnfABCDGE type electron transport complex subunit D [Clostridiales bacterium]|jgi:electron transport complex protein RnfD|nr:RnfABCDGE type electron transport complex subunit D [Clostridiales bacterium]